MIGFWIGRVAVDVVYKMITQIKTILSTDPD